MMRFYIAQFKSFNTRERPEVQIYWCDFERKPKSWRRVANLKDDASAWGYRSVFLGTKAPGYTSAKLALEALIQQTELNIRHKEETLAYERKKLDMANLLNQGYQE